MSKANVAVNFPERPKSPKTENELQYQDINDAVDSYSSPPIEANSMNPQAAYFQVPFTQDSRASSVPANAPVVVNSPSIFLSCFHFDQFKQYFQVETEQVKRRIIDVVHPNSVGFLEELETNPDFYGPFWISTTIIFLIFMTNEVGHAVFATGKIHSSFSILDFERLTLCCLIIYSYAFGFPVVVWAVLNALARNTHDTTQALLPAPVSQTATSSLSLLVSICLYGYSLFPFVPVAILCVFPFSIWRLICITVGFIVSGWSLFRFLSPITLHHKDRTGFAVLGACGVAHFLLALIFKLVFYR